jgi:RNA polymerase sigma-70 factor (ECF subfamily)
MDPSDGRHVLSTSELIRCAQDGDRPAFDVLVKRHRQRLLALIEVRLGPQLRRFVEVEDVEQETYLQALRSLTSFDADAPEVENGAFFRWLGGITEHVIQNLDRHHLKTRKRSPQANGAAVPVGLAGVAPLLQGHGTTPSRLLRRRERLRRLEEALDRLSEDHREVLILSRLRGLSVTEIAERMGRSPDAVSMLILRALRQLRALFGTTDSCGLPPEGLGGGPTRREDP